MIRVLIKKKRSSCLVTAPGMFGKSSIIDTLRTFFELQTDNDGRPISNCWENRIPVTDTSNYKLFMEPPLNITKSKHIMNEYFGRYPLIHINFKCGLVKTMTDVENKCKKIISNVFCSHK